MATKVYMEALSPTMEEGTLLTWSKNEGDEVNEGDVLAEVETDKATMELVARGSGVLRKRLIEEGETANVGTIIGIVAGPDEDIAGLVDDTVASQGPGSGAEPSPVPGDSDVAKATEALAGSEHTEEHQAERGTPAESAATQATSPGASVEGAPTEVQEQSGRVKASPLARRMAEDAGLALQNVRGSGPGGRIVKRDVEAAAEAGTAQPQPAAPAAAATPKAPAAPATAAEYEEVPLSQMRKTIARRLSQSIGPVPHFFLTVEVDMKESMAMRKKLNARFADDGIKVSPNDLIIKSVAMALKRHPWVNASWSDQGIRKYDAVHIGVAVAVEDGLITPVIRNAHQKGITAIAEEVKELAGRAREMKLTPEEYTGSTFSISNLGMFAITEFTAIINPPEAAILAVGAIEDKVVVEDGEMVVRPRMRVTLSCDHRVIDGATGAQFLQTLKSYLEEPMMMIA